MPAVPAAAGATPEPPAGAAAYTISDLAREFALTTRAIRFYEHEGLLSPQRRGRVRIYGERERVRITRTSFPTSTSWARRSVAAWALRR